MHHVVRAIVAPFGEPIESRPAVPSEEERLKERAVKRAEKLKRRKEARRMEMVDGKGEGERIES